VTPISKIIAAEVQIAAVTALVSFAPRAQEISSASSGIAASRCRVARRSAV
jgi:hypothetical protein